MDAIDTATWQALGLTLTVGRPAAQRAALAPPRRRLGPARRRLVAAPAGRRAHRHPPAALGHRRLGRDLGRPAGVQPGGLARDRARGGVRGAVRGVRRDAGAGGVGAQADRHRAPGTTGSRPEGGARRRRTRTWTTSRRSCSRSTASSEAATTSPRRWRGTGCMPGSTAPSRRCPSSRPRRPYVVDLDAVRRQRRRPGPPRRRQAGPGRLQVAARAGAPRAGPGDAGLLRGARLLAARGAVAVRAGRQRRHRDGLPVGGPRRAAPADRVGLRPGRGDADGGRRAPPGPGGHRPGLAGAGPGRPRRGRRAAARPRAPGPETLALVRRRRRRRAGRRRSAAARGSRWSA